MDEKTKNNEDKRGTDLVGVVVEWGGGEEEVEKVLVEMKDGKNGRGHSLKSKVKSAHCTSANWEI